MRPTFEKTVDILVKAYLNDTLQLGNCHACAVGNIVAANMGYSYKPNPCEDEENQKIIWSHRNSYYVDDYEPYEPTWYQLVKRNMESKSARIHVSSTGYTVEELYQIENAFEGGYKGKDKMFNALLIVVDVLAEIHNVDLSVREEAKLLFVKS